MLGRSLLVSFAFIYATSSQALTRDQIKSIIDNTDVSFNKTDHGKLCEIIGVEVMREQRPNATILNGVEYKNKHQIIGELDLVVVEDGKADEVIEVKCQKSYSAAANHADEQLERFSAYIGRCDIDFSLEGQAVPCDVFANSNIQLRKMSYEDAKPKGFDLGLGVTRAELLDLIEGN